MEHTLAEAIRQLELGQVKIQEELKHMKEDVATKHGQNRKDIHAVRNVAQQCYDKIHNLELKQVKSASVSGAVVAGLVEGIRLITHYVGLH